MDKDRVKGKMDDVAGRVKRQAGEWTGDTETQVEGAAQQVKGKAQNAWGKAKDAARDATKTDNTQRTQEDVEIERERRKKDVA
ncbi:MAG TPA: CsbD family protein [Candidatus Binatia bacterium]|nr:CsbD family protein [Candidatus Binatia bacterium]